MIALFAFIGGAIMGGAGILLWGCCWMAAGEPDVNGDPERDSCGGPI